MFDAWKKFPNIFSHMVVKNGPKLKKNHLQEIQGTVVTVVIAQ